MRIRCITQEVWTGFGMRLFRCAKARLPSMVELCWWMNSARYAMPCHEWAIDWLTDLIYITKTITLIKSLALLLVLVSLPTTWGLDHGIKLNKLTGSRLGWWVIHLEKTNFSGMSVMLKLGRFSTSRERLRKDFDFGPSVDGSCQAANDLMILI